MTLDSVRYSRFLSEEVLARLFHASPVAISLSTLDDGRYLEVNDRFLQITGYAREEVIGRRSTELGMWTTWADRARVVQALRMRQPVNDLELAIHTRSGELRYVRAFFESIEVEGQRCIFSMFHDITAKKQAEQNFRSVVEESLQGITIYQDDRIVYANRAVVETLGYTIEELLALSPAEVANLLHHRRSAGSHAACSSSCERRGLSSA